MLQQAEYCCCVLLKNTTRIRFSIFMFLAFFIFFLVSNLARSQESRIYIYLRYFRLSNPLSPNLIRYFKIYLYVKLKASKGCKIVMILQRLI